MSTSQVLQYLYSFNTFSPDFSRCLDLLIKSDDADHYLLGLQRPELTRLVDFLDRALGIIPVTEDVSRRCLNKLQDICSHHGIVPPSHIISGGLVRVGDYPVASTNLSDVWEGTHNGAKVCIKSPRVNTRERQAIEKAFYKEAIVWKNLKHENIVPFIGVTQDPLQFVSEWMPNGDLMEYIDRNPGANRIGLLLDVAEGLAYLHVKHAIHGDLKGSNILISRKGRARLTDFGFTSVVRGLNSVRVPELQGCTLRWAAPEIIRGESGGTQGADIYSFGMVVIEVFTRMCPFPELADPIVVSEIMEGERPNRPQEQDLSDPIWDMTKRCWKEDPVLRPRMEEVVAILRERPVPVSGTQQSTTSQSSILSGSSQQEPVAPSLGIRPPAAGSSESFPDPIDWPGAIGTSRGRVAELQKNMTLVFCNIQYSPCSYSTRFKATLKYGNVIYKVPPTNSTGLWGQQSRNPEFLIQTNKGDPTQSVYLEVFISRNWFIGFKPYATGNFSLFDFPESKFLNVQLDVHDRTGFATLGIKTL